MDKTTFDRLLQSLDTSATGEPTKGLTRARTDPEAARKLWQLLLTNNTSDEQVRAVLEWILESVLVDQITNHMGNSDEYALVIGRRISTLLERVARLQHEPQAKTA